MRVALYFRIQIYPFLVRNIFDMQADYLATMLISRTLWTIETFSCILSGETFIFNLTKRHGIGWYMFPYTFISLKTQRYGL